MRRFRRVKTTVELSIGEGDYTAIDLRGDTVVKSGQTGQLGGEYDLAIARSEK